MIEKSLTAILRLFSWLVFAGFERRITLAPRGLQPATGHSYVYLLPTLEYLSDTNEHPSRSQLRLTENGKPLGPAHTLHADISAKGGGRYSHYRSNLYFSASDNSDPRTNGRAYALSRTVTIPSFVAWLSALIAALRWLPGLNFLRRVKYKVWHTYFAVWIDLKWLLDKRRLPLTPGHWELYDNIHRFCWRRLGEFPNLISCRDYNDKIQWLKLFDQSPEIIRCTDKIQVRDYIRERIGEEYLLKLYQTHDHFWEIDFNSLPQQFVIKANNDSGTVILVREKSELDFKAVEEKVEAALRRPYGWLNGEWAYSFITPKVLVEEFLEAHNPTPPPDYKFYCSEGVAKVCRIITGRGGFDTKEQAVDAEGNDLALQMSPTFKLGSDFSKPALWNEMIEVAQELSRGHKFVRIDLFYAHNRIYVGEMTFWPGAGAYKLPDQKELGQLLDFERNTYKPLLRNLAGRARARSQNSR